MQPLIVYFPDSSLWLSRAVSKSHRKEFVSKVMDMFDKLTGRPVVLICGQNKVESGSREKEKFVRSRNSCHFSNPFISLFVLTSFHLLLADDDTSKLRPDCKIGISHALQVSFRVSFFWLISKDSSIKIGLS